MKNKIILFLILGVLFFIIGVFLIRNKENINEKKPNELNNISNKLIPVSNDSISNSKNKYLYLSNVDSTKTPSIDDNCKNLIVNFMTSSNYKNPFDNSFHVWIESKNDSIMILRLSRKSHNHDGMEIIDARLKVDLINNRLFDLSNDFEEPKQLSFDKTLLEAIKKKCK